MSEERRNFIRVSSDCMIAFRKKTSHSDNENKLSANRFHAIASTEISDIASRLHLIGDQRDEMIVELLLWIDWKVNYLMKALIEDKEGLEFPHEAVLLDLSASGMKFTTHEQVEVGTDLQLRFFLPVLPFNEMILCGAVTRSKQQETKIGLLARYEIGIEFSSDISESDQESIFRYVLKRERQMLQANRDEVPNVNKRSASR